MMINYRREHAPDQFILVVQVYRLESPFWYTRNDVLFFKYSDLRATNTKPNPSTLSPSATSPSVPTVKGCQSWNYKGSCSCDSSSGSYTSNHLCRVFKSTEHPMLHCPKPGPKPKMLIPGLQRLDTQSIGLSQCTDLKRTRTQARNHDKMRCLNMNLFRPIYRVR